MSTKNLDQIRAANALAAATGTTFRGANDGEVVKKIPAMIRQNGILGALAFAQENDTKTGHADVFRAIVAHLRVLRRLPDTVAAQGPLDGFMKHLCAADSAMLRAVTDEAMAYLNYLRRFAKKGQGHDPDRD